MNDGYMHGIGKLSKPTTRVIHKPGGDSSLNIFSTQQPQEQKPVNQCQVARSKSSVFATGDSPVEPKPAIHQPEEYPMPNNNKSSTRVLNPPGGQTSVNLFGGSACDSNQNIHVRGSPNPYEHKTDLFGGQPAADNRPATGNRRRPPGGESHNIFG